MAAAHVASRALPLLQPAAWWWHLLLYRLRHVILFLESDEHRDIRYWLHNNVEKVLLHV